jgi:hypothetical protein
MKGGTMDHGAPCWEWRTFGPSFGSAETRIRKLPVESAGEHSDLFVLSERSNDIITIRDGKIKVKSPLRQNAEGLEQRARIFEAEFPLGVIDISLLYKMFGLPMPWLEADRYDYQPFLDDIVKPCGWLSLARVNRARQRFTLQGAEIKLCEVSIAGIDTRSLAIRHTDPAQVAQLVKDLGLSEYKCETLIKAVKRIMEVPWFVPEM